MKWFVNKLVTVQTMFFLYIIVYSIATLTAPNVSAAMYISHITGGYVYPLALVFLSGLFALAGLFRASTPVKLWVFLLPFVLYSGTAFISILVSPTPSLTGMTNFLFMISLCIAFTWEKING